MKLHYSHSLELLGRIFAVTEKYFSELRKSFSMEWTEQFCYFKQPIILSLMKLDMLAMHIWFRKYRYRLNDHVINIISRNFYNISLISVIVFDRFNNIRWKFGTSKYNIWMKNANIKSLLSFIVKFVQLNICRKKINYLITIKITLLTVVSLLFEG